MSSLSKTLLVISLLGCSKPSEAVRDAALAAPETATVQPTASSAPVRYTARGVVRSVDDEKALLWIAHEDIPGYMKAMTMPFVASPAFRRLVHAGDRVEFSFHDDGSGNLVLDTLGAGAK
jgi:protein SCO1/2